MVGMPGRLTATSRMPGPADAQEGILVQMSLSCPARTAQAEALKMNRPLLAVGTPGRLAEMSRMGVLQTHSTRILVLDEVRRLRSHCSVMQCTALRLSDGRQSPCTCRHRPGSGRLSGTSLGVRCCMSRGDVWLHAGPAWHSASVSRATRRWTSCWRCSSRRT